MFSTTVKKALFKRSSVICQASELKPKPGRSQSHGDEASSSLPPKWVHWRQLSPNLWQLPPSATSSPPVYFFHGDKLGPRPLIVLDEVVSHDMSLPPVAKNQSGSKGNISGGILPLLKYEGILSQMQLEHGVISLPLYYDPAAEKALIEAHLFNSSKRKEKSIPYKDFITRQCESVIQLMDTYHIQWANILCRSTGALLAAKLALLYPERVGGLISLDTPLVAKQWQVNTRLRREILKAIHDVNVPTEELVFAVRGLIGGGGMVEIDDASLEPVVPVPCPSKPQTIGSKMPFYCYQQYIQETPDGVSAAENTAAPATYTFDNGAIVELINSIAILNQSCYEDTIFPKELVYPGVNMTSDPSADNSHSTPFSPKALLQHPLFASMADATDGKRTLENNVAVGLLRVDGLVTSTELYNVPDNSTEAHGSASSAAMIHHANANPTVSDTMMSLLPNRVRSQQIDRHHDKTEEDNDDIVGSDAVCRGTRYSLQGSAYLSIDNMRYIKHPLMLIVPPSAVSSRGPLSDIDSHRSCFNIRKATVVKSACGGATSASSASTPKKDGNKKSKKIDKKENEDIKVTEGVVQDSDTSTTKSDELDYSLMPLFESAAVVKEVAHHCRSFLNRFDFDVVIRRRMEQVSQDTMKKMNEAKAVGARASGDDDGGSGKKKKKKTPGKREV